MEFRSTNIRERISRIALKTTATAALTAGLAAPAYSADTIKVGVLHSLSGTMAISETTLKDTMLMLVDEQNKKGGVLGKQLEAVVVDPASEKSRCSFRCLDFSIA